MEREVLSSCPWDPATGWWERLKAAPGEVQTGCEEAVLHRESGQALGQAAWRGGRESHGAPPGEHAGSAHAQNMPAVIQSDVSLGLKPKALLQSTLGWAKRSHWWLSVPLNHEAVPWELK